MFKSLLLLLSAAVILPSAAQAASFDCTKVEAGSIEELVCKTPALSQQDDELAKAYKQAVDAASGQQLRTLKAEQRGWIKGRDDCWKFYDRPLCVARSYKQRMAELQAR